MLKPVPIKKVLEVRYERGYRYLDRCGEVMLILQDLLPSETGKVWMPEDITPNGAKLKCPELEMRIVFDTTRFVIDQSEQETEEFSHIASTAFAVVSSRFDLRSFVRLGLRRFLMVGADSVEDAELLSLKLSPATNWPPGRPANMVARSSEISTSFEDKDGAVGFSFTMKPISKIDTPDQIDERARVPARFLEKGQKEALLEQIKRRTKREKDPSAGVLIDLDYYQMRPVKLDLKNFWQTGIDTGDKMIEAVLARK
jgi:hypothetical protein